MTGALPDPEGAPLIVTVRLDALSQGRFERERQRLFPASRNHIPAHVSLFHHLPGDQRGVIAAALAEASRREPPPFLATGLQFLGYGTAYALDMPDVARIRKHLASCWSAWLTAQDRQPWRPHVTVQNKVSAAAARQTHQSLLAGFQPFSGTVAALVLWRYLGGPWEKLAEHAFATRC